jgi:hypothetical protein
MSAWIAQLGIVFFGLAAVTLSQSSYARLNRFACIFGLLGQPFWAWAIVTAEPMQWGMLILSLFYSIAWARALRVHWFPSRAVRRRMRELEARRECLVEAVERKRELEDLEERRARLRMLRADELDGSERTHGRPR